MRLPLRMPCRPRPSGSVLLAAAVCAAAGCGRPTYHKDVAPIVFTHCLPCHRTGQPVPFTFARYEDARQRASKIAEVVRERRMPPWLPDAASPAFLGERHLSDREIATVEQWAATGAREGDAADRPPMPSWPAGWELGTPDMVSTMAAPYVLAPGRRDAYRNVILPVRVPATRYVRAVEFRPEGAPVHHAVIRLDRGRTSQARDGEDGQPGFDGMMSADVRDPDGHFVGWAPGRGPIVAPDGMPWAIDPGSDLVVELHLLPGKTAIGVRPSVGLYFADGPPREAPVLIVMGSQTIDIPAGADAYAVEDVYELPVDARVLSVYPHAHYLGKEMTVTATSPGGGVQTLLHIPRWSFHWQQDYRFVTPIALRRGTRIAMRFTYDNSDANEDNPSRPPRRVTWGPQSTDEMGNVGIQLVAPSAAEAATLAASFARHAAEIDLAGARMRARDDPRNPAHAEAIGTALNRLGRFADAVPALEQAVALDPRSASARNHLAGALLGAGRSAEALGRFKEASALSPGDAHLHYNYARVLADAGDAASAQAELARAIALADLGEAHQLLGSLLFAAGRTRDALPHLRAAIERLPESAAAHSDYGGALAASGEFIAAAAELRRALQIDPAYAPARENLDRLTRLRAR